MMKLTFKKFAFKAFGVTAFFAFAVTFFGMNNMHAQSASASLSEQVNSADRDYVDQFKAAVEPVIYDVRNDSNMDQDEKTVRIKMLIMTAENVQSGLLIEDAFDVSYNALLPKVNQVAPNVNLKNILSEYKNRFS